MSLLSKFWAIDAFIYEERTDKFGRPMLKEIRMKARKLPQVGGEIYQLANGNKVFSPPSGVLPIENNKIYLGSKQKGSYFWLKQQKPLNMLELTKIGDFTVIDFKGEPQVFEPIKQSQRVLYRNEVKLIETRKNRMDGLLSKVLPIIVLLVLIVGVLIILNSLMNTLGPMAKDMAKIAEFIGPAVNSTAAAVNKSVIPGF